MIGDRATVGFLFLGTPYMQQVLGFSALATGAAWMTASVTSLTFAGLSQRIATWPGRSSSPASAPPPDPVLAATR